MSKKNVVTVDMACNDFKAFLLKLGVKEGKIDEFLSVESPREMIHNMFKDGDLRLTENTELIQLLSDGQELKFTPRRPKIVDLNRIKPPHYDRMDAENQALVKVSWLTGATVKELQENYYESDLAFAIQLCNFL